MEAAKIVFMKLPALLESRNSNVFREDVFAFLIKYTYRNEMEMLTKIICTNQKKTLSPLKTPLFPVKFLLNTSR